MLFENLMQDKDMAVESVIYNLSDECIKSHPMIMLENDQKESFYSWLRKAMNVGDEYNMDCTKIHIAKNIQDEWVNYAQKSGIDNIDINMTLLQYAPRVDEILGVNQIRIYDGFLTKSKED
jgi:hypothetical protein